MAYICRGHVFKFRFCFDNVGISNCQIAGIICVCDSLSDRQFRIPGSSNRNMTISGRS